MSRRSSSSLLSPKPYSREGSKGKLPGEERKSRPFAKPKDEHSMAEQVVQWPTLPRSSALAKPEDEAKVENVVKWRSLPRSSVKYFTFQHGEKEETAEVLEKKSNNINNTNNNINSNVNDVTNARSPVKYFNSMHEEKEEATEVLEKKGSDSNNSNNSNDNNMAKAHSSVKYFTLAQGQRRKMTEERNFFPEPVVSSAYISMRSVNDGEKENESSNDNSKDEGKSSNVKDENSNSSESNKEVFQFMNKSNKSQTLPRLNGDNSRFGNSNNSRFGHGGNDNDGKNKSSIRRSRAVTRKSAKQRQIEVKQRSKSESRIEIRLINNTPKTNGNKMEDEAEEAFDSLTELPQIPKLIGLGKSNKKAIRQFLAQIEKDAELEAERRMSGGPLLRRSASESNVSQRMNTISSKDFVQKLMGSEAQEKMSRMRERSKVAETC